MIICPTNIIASLNKLIWNYIWQGPDKVKRTTTCKSKQEGGLNMIDIKTQFTALKAAWAPRIINSEDNWAKVAKSFLNTLGPDLLCFKMKLDAPEQLQELNKIPEFYREVVVAFVQSKFNKVPTTPEDLKSEIIWGNKLFTLPSDGKHPKSLHFESWINLGIIYIGDLQYKNGLLNLMHIHSFIDDDTFFHTECLMMNSALKKFKHLLTSNDIHTTFTKQELFYSKNGPENVIDKRSKFFYTCLRNKISSKNNCEAKWVSHLDDDSDFKQIYTKLLCLTKDKHLLEFNFKFLHLILPTNQYLSHITAKTDKCNQCNTTEDIQHMLFTCPTLRPFWYKIRQFLQTEISITTFVSCKDTLSKINRHILNYVIYYVFLYRYLNNLDNRFQCNAETYVQTKLRNKAYIYEHIDISLSEKMMQTCTALSEEV